MTKIITAVIILLVLWGGWELFFYWERVKNEETTQKKQAAAALVVGDSLPGMPYQLEQSWRNAQKEGVTSVRNFLKQYGSSIQDPRKAWMELDYCMLLAREDVGAAKKLFAEVKARTPQDSPVYPRIKDMARTFQ